ncbi:hypothetical protein [Bythopirellula goksoeyrii]|uniref:PEP-CTERM protein-sorting domain-containing protein n=1 Tax=Bythopirellula goksoeyrii TaxID=1400387 RepID=A0A5B9QHS7_9BACT|nr:hypothetical protein [Bythopirellula goksoeyrii]QEG37212.1 hypothetical protein Pr1d_45530 [Bythopirellula goksoeyrii]
MQRFSFVWVISWFCSVPTLGHAATLHTDDFQLDLSGWTTGGASVSYETTGGPAGVDDAFLRLESGFQNYATFNSNPAWTGDFTAVDAAMVTADMMAAVGSAALSMRLVLFGPGVSPSTSSRWTSTVAVDVPADGIWRNYSFPLMESDLTRVLGTDTYQNLMSDVLRVMLRHDSGTPSAGGEPVDGDLGIDNITLSNSSLAGDFNNDGLVDGADFLVWQRGDSRDSLGSEDLVDWQINYGLPLGGGPVIAVPEPATIYFLVAVPLFFRRRLGRR